MTKQIALLVFVLSLFGACVTNDLTVTWSNDISVNDGLTWNKRIACGDVASHPCARITHAHSAQLGLADRDDRGLAIRFYDFTGHDANGNELSEFDTNDNGYTLTGVNYGSDGSLVIGQAGDDIGLRWATTLQKVENGWAGSISWQLESFAGVGTMTVSIVE